MANRLFLCLSTALFLCVSSFAQKPAFTVGWSVYVGWDPYQYMAKSGVLKKWADKYGVTIKVQRFDYAPSLDAFTSKSIDACTMTNMEALDMPAASGIDTTAILIGDYSNGNDAVIARDGNTLESLSGKKVLLVQKTVSEYLLQRAFVLSGKQDQLRRVKLVNTSDGGIVSAFMSDTSQSAVVTWKPLVSQVVRMKNVKTVFDSSKIPGEILDLLVVRTEVLKRADGSGQKFAKAMAGAWYETLAQMTGPNADKVLTSIAAVSEDSLASYKEQLSTTRMLYKPDEALSMLGSPALKEKMLLVRRFCFDHKLLGEGTKTPDDVAIAYPDGTVQGAKERIRFRFDDTYSKLAAKGGL